ncbi:hypothetical protein CHS0354_031994 [Potamilus streckersoni]|uniref:Uncharacterized protein n=1 Tax=Potamilus streckersoni TaxID=2493646 RepID=A0AAE0TP84_9BIVA|nr:hypothetical protein CHS0354_031994 [Potamilus streckersoni]
MSSTKYSQPWIDTNVNRLNQRRKKHRKDKESGSLTEIAKYKDFKKEAKPVCQLAYNNCMQTLVDTSSSDNPLINSKMSDNIAVAPLKTADRITYSERKTKTNIINKQDKGPSPRTEKHRIDKTPVDVGKHLHDLNKKRLHDRINS